MEMLPPTRPRLPDRVAWRAKRGVPSRLCVRACFTCGAKLSGAAGPGLQPRADLTSFLFLPSKSHFLPAV